MAEASGGAAVPTGTFRAEPDRTGWVGWIIFGGAIMVMLGVFHMIQGLVALFEDGYYLVSSQGLIVNVDYNTWGWAHLILGGVVLAAGIALMLGQLWARVIATVLCLLSAIVNISFLAAYPVWSTIMIALDVVVIWAVVVHGREMKPAVAA